MPWLNVALQCLKYKTDQQVDIRKMEKLNALFFAVTATGERPSGEPCNCTGISCFGCAATVAPLRRTDVKRHATPVQ
jgi:hypothetical protein